MLRVLIWLGLVVATVTAACDRAPFISHTALAIEGGLDSPAALGHPMTGYHQNASLFMSHGALVCSATLVADRVVITATHCMASNPMEWFSGKEPPVWVAPEKISLVVGEDGKKLCALPVARFTVHPQTTLELEHYVILNDIAVLILEESAVSTCPQVLPIPPAPKAAMAARVGDQVLTTGFGSQALALTPRLWASLEMVTVGFTNFIAKEIGKGSLIHGDSGGGSFVETGPGAFGLVGVSSTVVKPNASLTSIGRMWSFIEKAATAELLQCPEELARGLCRGPELVECRDGAYSAVDCAGSGETCAVVSGRARCTPPVSIDASPPPADSGLPEAQDPPQEAAGTSGCSMGSPAPSPAVGLLVLLVPLAVLWLLVYCRGRLAD